MAKKLENVEELSLYPEIYSTKKAQLPPPIAKWSVPTTVHKPT